jgi:ribonuclease R
MAKPTQSIQDRILHFLSQPGYQPMKQHELARELVLKGSARADFRHALYELGRQGEVVRLRKNRWALPDTGRHAVGVLRAHIQGFGFVTPAIPGTGDIYIPEDGMGTALDGDKVAVALTSAVRPQARRVTRGPYPEPDRKAGRIVRVIERRHAALVGLLRRTKYYWYVIPDNPRIRQNVRVSEFDKRIGDPTEDHTVVVRLDEWDQPHKALSGVVVEDLGAADAPGVDMLSVLRGHRVETEFSSAAAHEAKRHAPVPSPAALEGRRDLRDWITFTIDPSDAKDFDDAVSLSRSPDGNWSLGVHIADVAHYVPASSTIDTEAYLRGNSVYLVDRAIPMLPPYLTTEICSLNPLVDRLTHSVVMALDDHGRLVHSETFPSVIRSAARLDYDQVQAFFDGKPGAAIPAPVQERLADMRRLARTLREKRMAAGSIDLRIPEIRCVLDRDGDVQQILKRSAMESYQLIEEFMLAANCVVARKLHAHKAPAVYRIHDAPDDRQWGRMAEDLEALDIRAAPSSLESVNAVALAAIGKPLEYPVHLAILRNLKRAVYAAGPGEHFGLAFNCYTHFTSPIRRYPDLTVHRVLNAVEAGRPPPYTWEDAVRIAAHCSETEQNADEAEQESVEIKRVEFLHEQLRKGAAGPLDGLIVSLVPKGMIVELAASLQRGLIPFSSMRDDVYVINPARHCAVGRRRRQTWRIGQAVRVGIVRVDTSRRLVDLALQPDRDAAPPSPAKRGKREPRGQRIK